MAKAVDRALHEVVRKGGSFSVVRLAKYVNQLRSQQQHLNDFC